MPDDQQQAGAISLDGGDAAELNATSLGIADCRARRSCTMPVNQD